MFKSMGVPNEQIARWTGMLGLAWVFKALWSPFLELARSKKRVIVAFQLLGGVALGGVALSLHLPLWFAACIALFAVVALASSTHDIAADGLYIASLTARQQAAYAGWQGAFFNAAKFLSLGGLVILAGYLEPRIGVTNAWSAIFGILGAALAVLFIGLVIALMAGRNATGWNWSTGADLQALLPWRLPRVMAALAAGIMLASSGVLIQKLTGNAMASPEVLGISSGAATGVVVMMFIVPGDAFAWLLPAGSR